MEREWMKKPRSTAEYKHGVEEFLSFAYRDVAVAEKILCPCVNCANRVTQIYDEVKTHLRCDGILQDYTRWVFHGEECDAGNIAFVHIPQISGNNSVPGIRRNNVGQDGQNRLDDMLGLINAAFGTSVSYESVSIPSDVELGDGAQSEFGNMELDVMHIEKNVCDNLIGTLLDINSKTKDVLHARDDLKDIGIRTNLQPVPDDKGRLTYRPAPFTMSREKKEILCSVIKNNRTPNGYASNISRCVNMKDCTLSGMKSHDCHVLIQEILPIALRSCYPSKEVMTIVIALADFFEKICSKVIRRSDLDELQESIVMTLCDMERIFLPSFFTVMVHLLVHLVQEVRLGGPVQYRWMYPLERSFVRLKSFVHNRARPKGSIVEGYIAEECLTFCSRFLEGTTRFNQPSRNPDPSDNIKEMYFFGSAGESIGKGTVVNFFDNQLLLHAHRYVLRHCDELEDLRREFLDHEKSKLLDVANLMDADIENLINKHFADWLEQKVLQDDGLGVSEKIRALAAKPNKYGMRYSGYIINGFRFHTMSHETGHVAQNSGVVNIATNGISYYRRLSDIWELSYKDYKVVLFKCDWYDVHRRAGLKQDEFGFTLVNFNRKIHTGQKLEDDPFVFSSQVKQVFYVEDPKNEGWNAVGGGRPPRDFFDMGDEQSSDESDDLSDSSGDESLD